MKTNRTAQLIYQSFYCALGLVAIFASFGIFDDITMLRWDFYVHFTNLSNYFCIAVMLTQLIQTAKKKCLTHHAKVVAQWVEQSYAVFYGICLIFGIVTFGRE